MVLPHVPSFFRCKCPSLDHCDKYLCGTCTSLAHFQSSVCCVVLRTYDSRGGTLTTLAHFRICRFRYDVDNLIDFRSDTCTIETKVVKI